MEGDLTAAARSLTNAGDEVAKLSHSFNELINGNNDQFARVFKKSETAIDTLTKTMSDVQRDRRRRPDPRSFCRWLAEMPQTVPRNGTNRSKCSKYTKLANENLKNLQGLTAPFGSTAASSPRLRFSIRPARRAASANWCCSPGN